MIIGRKREKEYLEEAFQSKKAQFITVYGRRRVGKTFLIDEFFKGKKCKFFQVTGFQGGLMKEQLHNFAEALSETFFNKVPIGPLKNWKHAFKLLYEEIIKSNEKVVVFLDELPWLASKRSRLMRVIEHDWNEYLSKLPQVVFIVCGSSASWILKKIIYNKGGLHNRTTCELAISPFNLQETKEYLREIREISYTDKQVLSLYMAVGGVPYYLEYAKAGLSAGENIQNMMFSKGAPLRNEFHKLFESLFEDAPLYMLIIKAISKKIAGVNRSEIIDFHEDILDGGGLSNKLIELEEAGLIQTYLPFGHKRKGVYYRLIDEFCLFYLYWIEDRKPSFVQDSYWLKKQNTPEYRAWSGYTFESICIGHINQIVKALNIKTASEIHSWRYFPKSTTERGAQIDLVINRDDDVITLCEIKYTDKPFIMDKAYSQLLERKVDIFKQQTKTKKLLFVAFISSNGVKENDYLKSSVYRVVTLKDLFKPL